MNVVRQQPDVAVGKDVPVFPTSRPSVGADELEALQAVFESRWLGTGVLTQQFQDEIARFLDARHVIAVNSGTAAIHIALEAVGVGPGDEVIAPSFTFVSTIQAIIATGARPIFCDIEPETGQMDVADALSRVTPSTRAVLPVHYGGSAVDMDSLLPVARERGLHIVEDAAHAFGSTYRGRKIGGLGDITCFSFDPIKNITCGTGGAAVTNDDALADKLRPLANVGLPTDSWSRLTKRNGWLFDVAGRGYRYRMADLNAAIGLRQMERVEQFRRRKIEIAKRYDEAFQGIPGVATLRRDWSETFPFHYAIRVLEGKRDELAKSLRVDGIGTTVHFAPNHLHSAFAEFSSPLPATEQLYREILTLPLYVELSNEDLEFIIGRVLDFFSKNA